MFGKKHGGILRLRGICTVAVLVVALGMSGAYGQTTNEWTAAISDSWFVAGNWSEDQVPESGPVQIDNNVPAVIDGSATGSIGNFFVGRAEFGRIIVRNGGVLNTSAGFVGSQQDSEGRALITGIGTVWNSANAMRIGVSGQGELLIESGALVNARIGRVGKFSSSFGTVEVGGMGSLWSVSEDLEVGREGEGSLLIQDQATVTNGGLARVGQSSGSTGSVVVIGEDSRLASGSSLLIGDGGNGSLTVSDGAGASGQNVRIGNLDGSSGQLLITGMGSTLEVNSSLSVGHFGGSQGEVLVSDGGELIGDRVANIGLRSGSVGVVQVSGAGSAWNLVGNTINVGAAGVGTLLLGGNATIVSNSIGVGVSAGSTGHFIIGDGVEAGTVDTARIDGGSGESTLSFDHASNAHYFTRDGSPGGQTIALINNLSLVHAGPGSTVISGDHSYTGETLIEAGTLQMDGSFVSPVRVQTGGRLRGSGSIDAEVDIAEGASLSPGSDTAGTLSIGSLTLAESSLLTFGLGEPGTVGEGVNDLVVVDGDLVLDGQLAVVNRGGFANGVYTLITYTGEMTNNGLDPLIVPGDAEFMIDTATVGEVRLIVADFFEPEDGVFSDRFEG